MIQVKEKIQKTTTTNVSSYCEVILSKRRGDSASNLGWGPERGKTIFDTIFIGKGVGLQQNKPL